MKGFLRQHHLLAVAVAVIAVLGAGTVVDAAVGGPGFTPPVDSPASRLPTPVSVSDLSVETAVLTLPTHTVTIDG
jgi:hypothetical protein